MVYVTFAEVQEVDPGVPDSDETLVEDYIAAVQAHVIRLTQRVWLTAADITKKYSPIEDVIFDEILMLGDWLGEITTVTNGDGVVVAADEYVLLPDEKPHWGIQILSSSGKSWSCLDDHQDSIEIVGDWYFTAAVPKDLTTAMIRDVLFRYRTRAKGDVDKLPRWVSNKYEELREPGEFA